MSLRPYFSHARINVLKSLLVHDAKPSSSNCSFSSCSSAVKGST
uniref:Uncharacterized protein n=1 Tax=Arundo donax TaxID=35708 RepID=A0A0A9CJL9_ARUDO